MENPFMSMDAPEDDVEEDFEQLFQKWGEYMIQKQRHDV